MMQSAGPTGHGEDGSAISRVTLGVALGMVGFITVLSVVALSRGLFEYSTETDFLDGFIPEASRFIRGEPLAIRFHPPLYSMVLGAAYAVVGNWMTAGVLISLVGGLTALACCYAFFRRTFGDCAAVGSVLALMGSQTFIVYCTWATSDVFSLALHMATFLAAYFSWQRRALWSYLVAGVLLGLSLVARTNNIGLLALLLFYVFSPDASGARIQWLAGIKPVLVVLAGTCVPVLLWVGYALHTGSPIVPTLNYQNLALTYFVEGDRVGGDSRAVVAEEFSSTSEVLTRNPGRIASVYFRDLAYTAQALAQRSTVLPFHLALAGMLCWIAIVVREPTKRTLALIIFANLFGFTLLLNFKAYDDRFYMFLLPFLGAAIGFVVAKLWRRLNKVRLRVALGIALAIVVALTLTKTALGVRARWSGNLSQDAFAAAALLVDRTDSATGLIIARKPHVAYYAHLVRRRTPQVATIEELVEIVGRIKEVTPGPVFVFFGPEERRTRPQLGALGDPATLATPGLKLIGSGPENGGWFLYEVVDSPDATNER